MKKLDMKKVQTLINLAVEEDFGNGDPTSDVTIAKDEMTKTTLVTREEIFISGMEVVGEILRRYDERLKFRAVKKDGEYARVAD